jgi:hypothetical protein
MFSVLCLLGVRPPLMVDGRPAKMSRSYVAYLKGLAVLFVFWVMCCFDFVP